VPEDLRDVAYVKPKAVERGVIGKDLGEKGVSTPKQPQRKGKWGTVEKKKTIVKKKNNGDDWAKKRTGEECLLPGTKKRPKEKKGGRKLKSTRGVKQGTG